LADFPYGISAVAVSNLQLILSFGRVLITNTLKAFYLIHVVWRIFIVVVRSAILLAGSLFLAGSAFAQSGVQECPVDLVNNQTLDEEFGTGTQGVTRCAQFRHNVKVVIQVNTLCKDAACTKPYALGNIKNLIKDYEITNGMSKEDYEIVAVVHSGGGGLVLQDGYTFVDSVKGPVTVSNKFQKDVEDLLAQGVKFYFCQNTTRGMIKKGALPEVSESTYGGGATEVLIPGVQYTTAGVTAISDLQSMGYKYIQP
jgi:intracellular sulfur oxidation DsrE/DsrF family protein